jgi:organic radical activating enzyme
MKQLKFNLFNQIPYVSQTFISLEGEGINVGEPSLYIRLAGCYSAACSFCDTKFSWYNKEKYSPLVEFKTIDNEIFYTPGEWYNEIKKEQKKYHNRIIERITITGGEPLHYIESLNLLNEILPNMYFEDNLHIKLLGIESNGNLLSSIDNVLKTIKTFKEFEKSQIIPHLTISPKIDSESCYENQLTQTEVNNMYKKVYYNLENYFPYENYYKFVWGVNNKMNNLILEHLEELDKLEVQKNHIFLMPFTPKDPLGKNRDIWEKSKDETARKALELGIRYSPRIHIDRKLD